MSIEISYGDDFFWDGLGFTAVLAREPTEAEHAKIVRLLDAWYLIGVLGGFGGYLHNMFDIERSSDRALDWIVDMGSAERASLDVLLRCIAKLEELEGVPIVRIIIGTLPNAE